MAKQTFAPIPNSLLRRKDLSHGAKLCCARLIQYAGKDNFAYPKLTTLSGELGMSKRAIQRFISELREKKLVTVKRRGLGKPNMYYLDDSVLIRLRIPDVPLSAPQKKLKVTTPVKPNPSPPYNKEERDNLKRKIEEITSETVDNMRMP